MLAEMLRTVTAGLVFQGLTLLSKTLLLFILARYLSAAELGLFGLIAVTLTLGVHFAGLDFYAYATREILARDLDEAPRLIRDQLVFHALAYLGVIPLTLLVFAGGILPPHLLGLFLVLLVLEHAAQELHRLMVTLSRPVRGAALLFVRGGVWVWVVFAAMAVEPELRTVRFVCTGWALGIAASLAVGIFWLRDLPWGGVGDRPIDWRWLERGLAVGLPLLLASSAMRGILSIDRYVLQHFSGEAAVGIYTFYSSVRNALQGFLELGVLHVFRPKIIAAFQNSRLTEYRRQMRRLALSLAGLTTLLVTGALILIEPVIALLGRPIYGAHLGAYGLVVALAAVGAAGELPHTALFARSRDRVILVSTLVGLAIALVGNFLLVPRYGIFGTALATLLAVGAVGAGKAWALVGER